MTTERKRSGQRVVLVTGSTGYLGGVIAKHLLAKGHKVYVSVRRLGTSSPEIAGAGERLVNWESEKSIGRVVCGVDVVIHAAGMNSYECLNRPDLALKVNGVNTSMLINSAVSEGVRRFIYFSTIHVYSNNLKGRITEESCTKNLHPYATSHLAGENVVLFASLMQKIDCFVLRLSNVFGVPLAYSSTGWSLFINDICKQGVMGGKIVLKSAGKEFRDFLPITRLLLVLDNILSDSPAYSSLFPNNIGSGFSMTVLNMAELVQERITKLMNFTPPIIVQTERNNDKQSKFIFTTRHESVYSMLEMSELTCELDALIEHCATLSK